MRLGRANRVLSTPVAVPNCYPRGEEVTGIKDRQRLSWCRLRKKRESIGSDGGAAVDATGCVLVMRSVRQLFREQRSTRRPILN
jgi:hypothetical protein